MQKRAVRFFAWGIAVPIIFYIFFLSSAIFMTYMYYFYPNGIGKTLLTDIVMPIMGLIFPVGLCIGMTPRYFTAVTISEKGVKKSFWGRFFVKEFAWDEIQMVRVFMVGDWIFFTKSDIDNLSYNQILKRKDNIQLALSYKVLNAIKCFTDKEIRDPRETETQDGPKGTE